MRSAAALASAFDEVAQVRYSRSGTSDGLRRPNQFSSRPGAAPGIAPDCRLRRRNTVRRYRRCAPRRSRAKSAPPGSRPVRDGDSASIRSRSKSSEVPSRPLRTAKFASSLNFGRRLGRELNAATHKMFHVLQTRETYRQSPSTVPARSGHPPQIVTECCRSAHLSSCLRHGPSSHDIATEAGIWTRLPHGAGRRTIDRCQQ